MYREPFFTSMYIRNTEKENQRDKQIKENKTKTDKKYNKRQNMINAMPSLVIIIIGKH